MLRRMRLHQLLNYPSERNYPSLRNFPIKGFSINAPINPKGEQAKAATGSALRLIATRAIRAVIAKEFLLYKMPPCLGKIEKPARSGVTFKRVRPTCFEAAWRRDLSGNGLALAVIAELARKPRFHASQCLASFLPHEHDFGRNGD
jgi:hypothetical protein